MTNNQRWKYWQQLFNLLHCSYFLWDQEKSDWSSVSAQAKPGVRRKPHPERLQLRWRGSGGRCFFFVAVLFWLILWMSVSRHSSVDLASREATAANMSTPARWIWTSRVSHRYRKIRTRTSSDTWLCVSMRATVCCCPGFYFTFKPLWNIYLKPIWYPCFGLDIFYCQRWRMKAFSHTLLSSLFWLFCVMRHYPPLKSSIILDHH